MQQPTCIGLQVRTPAEAHRIFHGVHEGVLRMITRRLDTEERRAISSGNVYVWEERGASSEATGMGIERWTDSIQWGPSRVRDEFLFYAERRDSQPDMDGSDSSESTRQRRRGFYRQRLTKQTYSVYIETPRGRRKWHMIAYFVPDTVHLLRTVEDHPLLSRLRIPRGMYTSARTSKTGPRHSNSVSNSPPVFPTPTRPKFPGPLEPPLVSGGGSAPYGPATLAPLAYLNRLPPPRRHVLDEMALNSFSGFNAADVLYTRSHISGGLVWKPGTGSIPSEPPGDGSSPRMTALLDGYFYR